MANADHTRGQQLVSLEPDYCIPSLTATASCQEVCYLGATRFYMKKGLPKSVSPHCEWFCASLARAAGIQTPDFAVITSTTDGQKWFGSENIDGEIKDWSFLAQAGRIPISDISIEMSKIYAFDLFIQNPDRNTGNYLVVKDGAGHKMYAFDHGHAWVCNKFPFTGFVIQQHCPTSQNRSAFKNAFGEYLDLAAMEDVLHHISLVKKDRVADIISGHPNNWLQSAKKAAILRWWSGGHAGRRIDVILKGIRDGTLV